MGLDDYGDDDMPISGAKVEIRKDGVLVETGYTDVNGKFSTSLEVGTYNITISKDGYYTQEKTEVITRDTELMVNLPSVSLSVKTDFDVSVLAGEDKSIMVGSSYEVTVP